MKFESIGQRLSLSNSSKSAKPDSFAAPLETALLKPAKGSQADQVELSSGILGNNKPQAGSEASPNPVRRYVQKGLSETADRDGTFNLVTAAKNFGKGAVKEVTSKFDSPKKVMIGAAFLAGAGIAIAATGGAATPFILKGSIAVSMGMAGYKLGKGVHGVIKAKTPDEAEKTMQDFGASAFNAGYAYVPIPGVGKVGK